MGIEILHTGWSDQHLGYSWMGTKELQELKDELEEHKWGDEAESEGSLNYHQRTSRGSSEGVKNPQELSSVWRLENGTLGTGIWG